MSTFEDIKIFLPQYLTDKSKDGLFSELKQFPNNIDKRIYTSVLEDEEIIYQGDGIRDLLFVNLPEPEIQMRPGIVLSNTCDVYERPERIRIKNLCYSPIMSLGKYLRILKDEGMETSRVDNHEKVIREQKVTQIFFLPSCKSLKVDSIVFLDRICNCPPAEITNGEAISNKRLFTLSDYGYYLFLFKISIHFTRIREEIERN